MPGTTESQAEAVHLDRGVQIGIPSPEGQVLRQIYIGQKQFSHVLDAAGEQLQLLWVGASRWGCNDKA